MPRLSVRSRASAARRQSARTQGVLSAAVLPAGPAPQEDRWPPPLGNQDGAPVPKTAPPTGSLLYLISLGIVAAGVVAVFFGTSLSLIAHPSGGRTVGALKNAPEAAVQLPAAGVNRPENPPRSAGAIQSFAALPEPRDGGMASENDSAHHPVGAGTLTPVSDNADKPLVPSPEAAPPNSAGATASAPAGAPSSADIRELLEHGDALLRTGDVISARLFYEHAANAGDGRAALRLGATFDPAFLGRLGGKVQADGALAHMWYSRALDLGAVEAKGQLNSLEIRQRK